MGSDKADVSKKSETHLCITFHGPLHIDRISVAGIPITDARDLLECLADHPGVVNHLPVAQQLCVGVTWGGPIMVSFRSSLSDLLRDSTSYLERLTRQSRS